MAVYECKRSRIRDSTTYDRATQSPACGTTFNSGDSLAVNAAQQPRRPAGLRTTYTSTSERLPTLGGSPRTSSGR